LASLRFCFILVGVVLRNLWVLWRTRIAGLMIFLMREIIYLVALIIIGMKILGGGAMSI
jgi:hypothetical protein